MVWGGASRADTGVVQGLAHVGRQHGFGLLEVQSFRVGLPEVAETSVHTLQV